MNLIDAYVVQVLSKPYLSKYDIWMRTLYVDSWGSKSTVEQSFKSFEEADAIKVGDVFQF